MSNTKKLITDAGLIELPVLLNRDGSHDASECFPVPMRIKYHTFRNVESGGPNYGIAKKELETPKGWRFVTVEVVNHRLYFENGETPGVNQLGVIAGVELAGDKVAISAQALLLSLPPRGSKAIVQVKITFYG